jgi:hypothetical protein
MGAEVHSFLESVEQDIVPTVLDRILPGAVEILFDPKSIAFPHVFVNSVNSHSDNIPFSKFRQKMPMYTHIQNVAAYGHRLTFSIKI